MTKLDDAVQKILNETVDDPWTELCVATVKLAKALVEFDTKLKKYKQAEKEKKQ